MRTLYSASTRSLDCFQIDELALLMMTHFQVSYEDDTRLLCFDHDDDDDSDDGGDDDDGDDDGNDDNLPSSSPSV